VIFHAEVRMAGRKIRDAAEARELLDAAVASGVPRAEWARAQGVDGRSLNAWHLNLDRQPTSTPPPIRLIELVPATPMRAASTLRVRCGRFVVEVDAAFDDDALTRVLAVVASC
jgi:hypothetical protein